MSRPVRALYVHVPYCRHKCGYCDFYVRVLNRWPVTPLVDAVLAELAQRSSAVGLAAETIFVGGGTPTILPTSEFARLLAGAAACAGTETLAEFTVEANPATVTAEKAETMRRAGVQRVSIGAQSFSVAELAALERDHAPEQVAETVAACRAAGLARISLDLIFGIPGQTLASWRASLHAAFALEPEHLSCYGLTFEPGTTLDKQRRRGRVAPADEGLEADQYELMLDETAAAGYAQYEISNFARPGCECRHNLVYWRNEEYVGVGPSAAGYVDGLRYKNVPDMARYLDAVRSRASTHGEEERLGPEATQRETAMLALRLRRGIDRAGFARRFGRDPAAMFADAVAKHVGAGLLEVDTDEIRLTRAGLLLANRVMADFV